MNKDLTILLLLKDRAPFTWRWFKFYNQIGLPFKVLVADGGEDKSVEKLADKSLFPNVNYDYIRCPYDKDYDTFFKKICDALSRIKTEYVLFASNDDFYFADNILESIKFLRANPDYSTARGDTYNFSVKNEIYGAISGIQKLYVNTSNTASTATERIRIFSQYSNSLWHDINKTDKLREFYKNLCELKIEDIKFAEYFINAMTAASGKVYRGPGLHMLHQAQTDSVSISSKGDPFEWILSEFWPLNFSKMAGAISKQIARIDRIPEDDARHKFTQYYIANSLGKNMIGAHANKMASYSHFKLLNLSHIVSKDNVVRKKLKNFYLSAEKYVREIKNKKTIRHSPYYEKIKMVGDFLMQNN